MLLTTPFMRTKQPVGRGKVLMDCDGATQWNITQHMHRTTFTAWTTANKTKFRHKTQKVHRSTTLKGGAAAVRKEAQSSTNPRALFSLVGKGSR